MRDRRIMLILVLIALAVIVVVPWITMIRMPGSSYTGALEPLSDRERALVDSLRKDVETLAGFGERNYQRPEALARAADYLDERLTSSSYRVERQSFEARGQVFENLIVEVPGPAGADVVVVGGHYDTAHSSPGANDNGSGVAAVVALARAFAGRGGARTLRFVAFVNEEPPFFQSRAMGSLVYAERCKERGENVVAMMSLETIGYYRDEDGSQAYPFPFNLFYPSRGDFIAIIGNAGSRDLVRQVTGAFRRHARFPSEGSAPPGGVSGVGWSDHWAFWEQGYPAVMITDTAPFRYPHYHTPEDTPDKVDFERMARVVAGFELVIGELAGAR